jgi:hypothetical protein
MMEEIKACPYCGSDSTEVSDFYGSWCGACLDCEAIGPTALDINDAVLLWNAAANALAAKDAEIEKLNVAWRTAKFGCTNLRKERDAIARDYDNERNAATIMRAELNEQLKIATNLGSKRWKALNEIYIGAEKRTTNWCRRKAAEGLGLKEKDE